MFSKKFHVGDVFRALAAHEKGSAVISIALAMPLVIGASGFGVETTYWYYKDLQLQAAADAAAHAAAMEKRSGATATQVANEATAVALTNGYESTGGTITVNSPPVSGGHMNNKAVEVILSQQKKRLFTALFNPDPVTVRARAVAAFQDAGSACVLALHKSASKAALFSGSSATTFTNCSVMANSLASNAVTVQGSGKLSVSCLYSAGGVDQGGGVTLTDPGCTVPKTGVPPIGDPFSDLPVPSTSGSCQNASAATLSPGVYCSGLSLGGTKTLNPGTYVVTGGDFKINANANISNDPTQGGVTIYLSGTARVSMNGNATVKLSAPTSGTYSGVLFFGDRGNSGGSKDTFNGTAASGLTGAIYFASQDIQYLGNYSGDGGWTQVVGVTIEWSGNANVSQDCSSKGMRNIPAP